jgi:hypothetical protein
MAIHRTRKNKENPHYQFLYSWQPFQANVKGESKEGKTFTLAAPRHGKKAESLAQEGGNLNIKKNIFRGLILISLILILELVVYLAWIKFSIK